MSECVTSATLSRPSRVKSIWLINISAIVIWPSPSVACQTHTHTHTQTHTHMMLKSWKQHSGSMQDARSNMYVSCCSNTHYCVVCELCTN